MFFYRFEEVNYANIGIKVLERKYVLLKETPKGYWIKPIWDISLNISLTRDFKTCHRKWISKTSKRRYAYPTKGEALINFKARKRRQIQILTAQINNARVALACVGAEPIQMLPMHEREN